MLPRMREPAPAMDGAGAPAPGRAQAGLADPPALCAAGLPVPSRDE